MSHAPRSTPAGASARAAAAPRGAQRRHPADDLDLAARDLEDLARDVRNARSARDVHEHEERAQYIARNLVAAFRGPAARPSAAPIFISADGRSALW